MTTDLTTLLDGLLVIAGLVLVITGIVMFIRSKSSTDPSSVEAFGIKLNVTHPSLILVLAGVGLMLAPRLLPELPGKIAAPETNVETTAPPAPDPQASITPPQAAAPSAPDASPPPASATAAAPAVAPRPAAAETASASSPAVTPAAAIPAAPRLAVATPTNRTTSAPKPAPAPVPKPVPKPAPASVASIPSPTTPASTPSSTPHQASRPTLAYAALGLPISRSFWSGETRASYTARINATLQQSGREVLRMAPHNLGLDQGAFDAWWNESQSNPRSRELCGASSSPRALMAARVETPPSMSSIESAYWPELKLRLYLCASHKQYRQNKTLSPSNADNWPFSAELNSEIERFMRAYRADLLE